MNRCKPSVIDILAKLIGIALLLLAVSAHALEFSNLEHAGTTITVIRVDPQKDKLHLFRACGDKSRLGFANLIERLADRGQKLRFAMNAGMFEANLEPVGLLVADGIKIAPLNVSGGFGNFYLKPNGVFLISDSGARIVASSEYAALRENVVLATQSGPLLLRAGKIHPSFDPASSSKQIRNGVGITDKGNIVFAISEGKVNFYDFATLFRDKLHCTDALYLDGSVSSLYAPALGRNDAKSRIGPIVGVLE